MDRLTIPEYNLLMKAVQLKQIDMDYRCHMQAFLNFAVQAKRKSGKYSERPVYTTFLKFYDYENELKKIDGKHEQNDRFSGLKKLLKKQQKGG